MKLAILALATAASAALLPTASHAAYVGRCSGTYDTNCYTYVCDRNCLEVRCAVWIDVVPGTQSGCFG